MSDSETIPAQKPNCDDSRPVGGRNADRVAGQAHHHFKSSSTHRAGGGAGNDTRGLGADDDLGNGNIQNDTIKVKPAATPATGFGNDFCAADVENPISC